MEGAYKVLIKIDNAGNIISVDSDAFVASPDDWIQIDEGIGDRYHHAQNNYFPKSKYDDRGILRYTYVKDGSPKWRERTQEEMDEDYTPLAHKPTAEELLEALLEGVANA